MDYQRQQLAGRAHVEGLKLFLPPGRSEIVRQRAANLNRRRLPNGNFTNSMSAPRLVDAVDVADSGNIITRLTRAVDIAAA